VTAVIPAVTAPPATTEATGSSTSSVPFRPWRIDFTRPDVVEYPKHPATASPESATITKRLVLLLGLAYLFLAALTSGLAYTGYFTAASTEGPDPDLDSREPENSGSERSEEAAAPRPPSRHPDAPGLHTRPDGSRYLVMPLPADIADRFRGHTSATATPAVIGGGAL